MRRKKKIYWGFGPAPKGEPRFKIYERPRGVQSRSRHPTAGARPGSAGSLRADVISALTNLGYKAKDAAEKAAKATGDDFNSLFRSAMKQNPRVIPDVTDEQLKALRKLVRSNRMAQKKRKSKKKKNPMPAALKRYWAKKRARKAKAKRKKRNSTPRVKVVTRTKVKTVIRYRKPRKNPRKKRRNPPRHIPRHIDLGGGWTRGQIKKIARAIGRATGKRARVVSR